MAPSSKKRKFRLTGGTAEDLKSAPSEAKKRVAKEPVYTGDDPVKKAYYAKKGQMKVRTGRGVVPVEKLAVPKGKKGKKGAKTAMKDKGPKAQRAPDSTSVLTTGRIG